jgi:hypothetical protein
VLERVLDGAPIIGLYPPTKPESEAAYADWRKKHGR